MPLCPTQVRSLAPTIIGLMHASAPSALRFSWLHRPARWQADWRGGAIRHPVDELRRTSSAGRGSDVFMKVRDQFLMYRSIRGSWRCRGVGFLRGRRLEMMCDQVAAQLFRMRRTASPPDATSSGASSAIAPQSAIGLKIELTWSR